MERIPRGKAQRFDASPERGYGHGEPSTTAPARERGDHAETVAASKDASIDALATAVPRVLRSAGKIPSEFSPAERRLFLLSAARWTRYRPPELARHLCRHRTNAWRGMRSAAEENKNTAEVNDTPTPNDVRVFREHARMLNDDESRAMALVLADSRLLTPDCALTCTSGRRRVAAAGRSAPCSLVRRVGATRSTRYCSTRYGMMRFPSWNAFHG